MLFDRATKSGLRCRSVSVCLSRSRQTSFWPDSSSFIAGRGLFCGGGIHALVPKSAQPQRSPFWGFSLFMLTCSICYKSIQKAEIETIILIWLTWLKLLSLQMWRPPTNWFHFTRAILCWCFYRTSRDANFPSSLARLLFSRCSFVCLYSFVLEGSTWELFVRC